MYKYFLFSDIHGRNLTELKDKLFELGFNENNPNHILVSLGDLFDRGNDSYNLLKYINMMIKNNRCIALWGNHETILASWFYSNYERYKYVIEANKTTNTIKSFIKGLEKDKKIIINNKDLFLLERFYQTGIVFPNEPITSYFLAIRHSDEFRYYFNHLLPYYVINDKYLLCHSGLTFQYDYKIYQDDWNKHNFKTDSSQTLIEEETWALVIPIFNKPKSNDIPFNKNNYEKVIHGHLNTWHFNIDDPFNIYFGKNNICLDSPYNINILVINEDNSFTYKKYEDTNKIEDLSFKIKTFYYRKILLEQFPYGSKVIYKNKEYSICEYGGCYEDGDGKFYLELDLYNEKENIIIKNVNSSFVVKSNNNT